jgi:L-aminopeptidase/D-esterase-like protein
VSGEGRLAAGKGPVRTGVTVVHPRGRAAADPVFGAWFTLNGNGEMTGTTWLEESGFLEGPVAITNTHSVGVVRDAVIGWQNRRGPGAQAWGLPVVAETWDGWLNDTYGEHVRAEHAAAAIEAARGGAVAEGNVGGGTGMVCYEWKGGIGTASRKLDEGEGGYTVGVLVQANFGLRHQLRIAGLPVGRELREGLVYSKEQGSIIVVVATDAPLLPHQLERLARRAALGIARTGSVAGNGSGDLLLAFSTAEPEAPAPGSGLRERRTAFLRNEVMGPLFEATVGATEEAVVNALVAARTMRGRDAHEVLALPHDKVQAILRRHGLLAGGR